MRLAVDDADRRFYSTLAIVSGPALALGGWLAAFSDVGAVLIALGGFVSMAGVAVMPSRRRIILGALAVGSCWWPFVGLITP